MKLIIWTEDPDNGDLIPLKIEDVRELDIERTVGMKITSTKQGTIIVKDL